MAEHACPPLPSGSVDFNALNAALTKGTDPVKALTEATVQVAAPPAATAKPEAAKAKA